MIAAIFTLLCVFFFPRTEAATLVFKGTPVSRISATGDESNRSLLSSGQKHEFTLLITKKDGKYIWESRDQRELILVESGTFTHFISPGTGWIKIGHSSKLIEVLNTAKAAGISEEGLAQLLGNNHLSKWMLEHKYFYFEFITRGMFVGVYWGFADDLDP